MCGPGPGPGPEPAMTPTSVENNVVNHVALVPGVVETERAAQVFRKLLRWTVVVVTSLRMNAEGIPETHSQEVNTLFPSTPARTFSCDVMLCEVSPYLSQVKKEQSLHLKSFLPPWRSL